jgi:hypothetical protein
MTARSPLGAGARSMCATTTVRLLLGIAAACTFLAVAATSPSAASVTPGASATPGTSTTRGTSTTSGTSGTSDTSASIAPSLSPDRLHAKSALTFAIDYAGGELGVPSPVRRAVLSLPAGLTLDIPALRSCNPAMLLAHGVRGCPARSEIGTGHAVVVAKLAAKRLVEDVTLWVFLGPPRNLQPTFEILGEGYKPLSEQMVLTATALPDRAPYGEELVMSIPAIPTVPNEPDASVVSFSLTIGASGRHRSHQAPTVSLPSHCPRGGLPFAAAFTYADGSQGSALATVPCPSARTSARAAIRRARAARTISLEESGQLRLTSKRGFTLDEQGRASGTLAGTIYVRLRIVSTSSVAAEVSISARGCSIAGDATASYHRGSSTASFSGSLSIGHGTGSCSDAHGSGLSFSGTIQRSNDAIAVRVSGRVSE